jgi:nitrite reductase/ring-hydroxylating ferredoxin subunit
MGQLPARLDCPRRFRALVNPMPREESTPLARRQVLGAGVVGTALLFLPDACGGIENGSAGGSSGGSAGGSTVEAADGAVSEASEGGPDATITDASLSTDPGVDVDGGICQQGKTYAAISIHTQQGGIGKAGTSHPFTDARYEDPYCKQSRILLVHYVTFRSGNGYSAVSGSCTHECCDDPEGTGGPRYFANQVLEDGGAPVMDVVVCSCCGSAFSALDGKVLRGPASDPLQVLTTCASSGYVFIWIPEN